MAKFEGQARRMPKIEACLAEYGWKTLEDAEALCKEKGINVEEIVKGVQPIAFENAVWAYTLGTAIAPMTDLTEEITGRDLLSGLPKTMTVASSEIYEALKDAGLYEEAKMLAERSENLFLREWREHRHVHENYGATDGMGCTARQSDAFYHWGALLGYIALDAMDL